MLCNNTADFWKEVKALNNCKPSLPSTVEGVSGADNIAALWRQHYSALFNCIKSEPYEDNLDMSNDTISVRTHEVYEAIHRLSDNKSSGLDHITAEHLKHASVRLAPLLALCFTGFMIHGILPDSMLCILLVPVMKDKAAKWGSSISAPFGVSNGVRQGGILSPILFNLYVDDLSIQLRACNTGCILGKALINHLMYADDLVVFSPSSAGLQDLLNVCTEYGVQYDIEYNAAKSAVLICRTKQDKQLNFPLFKLAQKTLEVHKKVKYLGHFITEQMNDDDDIYRQRCKLYVQANTIARKFSFCSLPVKVALFKAYCTPLYTAPLWSSYKQCSMQKLHVAYNDAMRILCRIPRSGSASQMFVAVGVWTFKALLRKLMFNFRERLDGSSNSIILALTDPTLSGSRYSSSLRKHWLKCLCIY
ncbi:uncharacterized protein LOC121814967 [Haplochromis burtoni]|uniref:uncharacterized protein LOC121814967 n=1 Tax=Haplochromis burtoni TaxID=8153 RepID=UPI001C2D03F8|nr:uncharacterized protein LOC121814967 [Haplochromis burtoni]